MGRKCEVYIPGGQDCEHQMSKGNCSMRDGKCCTGKLGAAGANLQRAEDMLAKMNGDLQQQGQTVQLPRQMQ